MHENALEACRRKLRSFLEQMQLLGKARWPGFRGNTDSEFRAETYKHTKYWMRETDITSLLFDILDRVLPTDPLPAGTLLERAGTEKLKEIEDAFMVELQAIPIPYAAILYLPRFEPLGIPTIDISNGIRLVQLEGVKAATVLRAIFPKAEQRYSSPDEESPPTTLSCVFLIVERGGFYAPRNATSDKLVADFKRFFGLSWASQILNPNFVGKRTDAGFTSSIDPVQGDEENCKMIVIDKRNDSVVDIRELPLEFSRHANYCEFYRNRWFPPKAINVQRDDSITAGQIHKTLLDLFKPIKICLESEDAYSDILAGAEWSFDSEGILARNETYAFLYAAIGLEAVMLSPKEHITQTLGDRLAYLVAISREDRAKIKEKFVEFYDQRSQIVHGKAIRLKEAQVNSIHWGQRMLRRALRRELELMEPAKRPPHDPWP